MKERRDGMADSRYTKKGEAQLRGAGWCPGRCISTSGKCTESHGAIEVLCEFGQLSLRPSDFQVLEFGPDFEAGPETRIADRVISGPDVSIARALWDVVESVVGAPICNVAWELGQDEHAIGVDNKGVVYSATWRMIHTSTMADADVMKLADSATAWLNYWLDPRNDTRRGLHVDGPPWYEHITLSLKDKERPCTE